MKIKIRHIQKIGILYLAIPTMIFLLSWLKPLLAIASVSLLLFAIYYVFKHYLQDDGKFIFITKKMLLLTICVFALWCIISGVGGYFYQTTDHECRNLILKDLIEQDWPVVYENGYLLTYYIGFWMVPAVLAKVFVFMGATTVTALNFGHFFLWLWTLLGIAISYFLILSYLNKQRKKDQLLILLVFIFFSGCDVLGIIFRNLDFSMHLEWWANYYQFSSNTTQLFWVFNQAIPVWVGIMLLISEDNLKKDILVGLLLLLFSPFPLIGCFVICAFKAINIYWIKYKHNILGFLKEIFTVPNIISVFAILPFMALYFFANTRVSSNPSGINGFNVSIGGFNLYRILILLAFMILEFGVYLLFVYKKNKKNYLFYACLVFMPLFCIFRFGETADFQMRGSIPLLFALMLMVMKELCDHIEFEGKAINISIKGILLCFVLLIGSITPLVEMYRGYYYVRKEHKFNVMAKEKKSFGNNDYNFVVPNYKGTNFYKYVGK